MASPKLAAAVVLALLPLISASPVAAPAAAPIPMVTPSPVYYEPTRTLKRGLVDDIKSVLGSLGSNIPSYVASGVANFFQDLPTGAAVQKTLGLSDAQVQALPTQALNIP
jgi:hypothetical protein